MCGSQSLLDRAQVTALTAAPVDLKMNENHFSFSVSECKLMNRGVTCVLSGSLKINLEAAL